MPANIKTQKGMMHKPNIFLIIQAHKVIYLTCFVFFYIHFTLRSIKVDWLKIIWKFLIRYHWTFKFSYTTFYIYILESAFYVQPFIFFFNFIWLLFFLFLFEKIISIAGPHYPCFWPALQANIPHIYRLFLNALNYYISPNSFK